MELNQTYGARAHGRITEVRTGSPIEVGQNKGQNKMYILQGLGIDHFGERILLSHAGPVTSPFYIHIFLSLLFPRF
jgi:hypothetical protein